MANSKCSYFVNFRNVIHPKAFRYLQISFAIFCGIQAIFYSIKYGKKCKTFSKSLQKATKTTI